MERLVFMFYTKLEQMPMNLSNKYLIKNSLKPGSKINKVCIINSYICYNKTSGSRLNYYISDN